MATNTEPIENETNDPDILEEEELGDAEMLDRSPQPPQTDDADGETADEGEEPVDDGTSDTEEEETEQKPEKNDVNQQLMQQVQSLTQGYNQLVNYVQGLQRQLQQAGQTPAQPPIPHINDMEKSIPTDVEGYTQREVVGYTLKQANAIASQAVESIKQPLAAQFQLINQVISVLMKDHKDAAIIQGALQRISRQPGVDFAQAYEAELGMRAQKENERLKSRQHKFDQRTQKLKRRVSGQPKPNAAPVKKTAGLSTRDAIKMALRDMGVQ